jgi:outer membrane murein-binding lipoprotein Lpp
MRNSEEGCVLQAQQEQLKGKVENIDERLTKIEADFGKMRSETQAGFKQGAEAMQQISVSVANLAHDFGQRFNNIETTVVAEKVEWGKTLRKILVWTAKTVLVGALVAMGIFTSINIMNFFK